MSKRSTATHTIRLAAPIGPCQRFFTPDGYRRVAIEVETDSPQGVQTLRPFVYLKPAQHFSLL